MADLKTWRLNRPPLDNNGNGKRKKIIIGSAILLAVIIVVILCIKFFGSDNKDTAKKVNDTVSNKQSTSENAKNSDAVDPENEDLIKNDTGAKINAGALTPQTGKANGIDVSKWQGKVNWQTVKSSGTDFAIIRIGFRAEDGNIYKDSYADYNIQQAQKAGVLVGVYFFSTAVSETEAKAEASWTTSAIAGYSISYPVVFDCEGFSTSGSRMYGISKSKRTDIALAFLNSIKSAGYEGMLYSAKSELENSASWDTPRIEKSYMVWVAQYAATPYPQKPSPDYSGKYNMWQYTNMGQMPGISGNTDLIASYFTRSKAEPKDPSAKISDAAAPSQDLKIYTSANDSVTAKEVTNLRDAASTKSNIVGTLKNGDFLSRSGVGTNGWSKLTYNGQTVYAITSYLTTDHNYTTTTIKSNAVNGQNFKTVNEKVTAKKTTNLRSTPSTDGALVATINNGDFLIRTGIGDKGWSRLTYDGQTVYAVASYLTDTVTTTSTTTTKAPAASTTTTQSTTSVSFTDVTDSVTANPETNLRSSPSKVDNSNVIVLLKSGEYVPRTGVSNSGWSRLIYNGQTVYAWTANLKQQQP